LVTAGSKVLTVRFCTIYYSATYYSTDTERRQLILYMDKNYNGLRHLERKVTFVVKRHAIASRWIARHMNKGQQCPCIMPRVTIHNSSIVIS
jgi:hypothetical protein